MTLQALAVIHTLSSHVTLTFDLLDPNPVLGYLKFSDHRCSRLGIIVRNDTVTLLHTQFGGIPLQPCCPACRAWTILMWSLVTVLPGTRCKQMAWAALSYSALQWSAARKRCILLNALQCFTELFVNKLCSLVCEGKCWGFCFQSKKC